LNLWEAIGSSTSADDGVVHWTFTAPLGRSEKSGRSARAAYGYHYDCTPIHGYEATREAAMAAFAKSWRRE